MLAIRRYAENELSKVLPYNREGIATDDCNCLLLVKHCILEPYSPQSVYGSNKARCKIRSRVEFNCDTIEAD